MARCQDEVARLMRELQWNPARLSRKSGVSRSTISRFFSGRQRPSLKHLTEIAHSVRGEPGDFLPTSAVDPMREGPQPLIEHLLAPLSLEDQTSAIAALRASLAAMTTLAK